MTDAHVERFRGYVNRAPRSGPETVHLDVTNTCNLDCVTCWNYAPRLATPKTVGWKRKRIDPVVFFRVLDDVASAGAERIVISGGGEPFTHPDIERFITAVKQKGLRLTVITNGTLCDFESLKTLQVDQILLNMASATPATYVAYHPNQPEQTFHRLLDGARTLRGTTAVNLVQVINRLNAHELVAMVEMAHDVGARCSFKVGDLPTGTESLALTEEQRSKLLEYDIPAARARAKVLGVKHNLNAYETQLSGAARHQPACFAGYFYSRISVEGQIFFCCAHIEAGHVSQGPFSEVWASGSYQALRDRMHRGEAFSDCERCGKYDMNFAAQRELDAMLQEGVLP